LAEGALLVTHEFSCGFLLLLGWMRTFTMKSYVLFARLPKI
jgi:hypothetical protein